MSSNLPSPNFGGGGSMNPYLISPNLGVLYKKYEPKSAKSQLWEGGG